MSEDNFQTKARLFDAQARQQDLLNLTKNLEPVRCAVVYPCDSGSLSGAIDSAKENLIIPILVGPEAKIRKVAEEASIDLSGIEIVSVEGDKESATLSASMAAEKKVHILMKGSLHTDDILRAVLGQPTLRTKRRFSHVFRFDVPMYDKPLLITDAAINIKPTLTEKVDIIQNAINFAKVLGIEVPKVAILSAVETVNINIPSTIDAAALCKMSDRGQIKGGILDGPLAFDNAISQVAADIKGIKSPVAGCPDILVAPDLESGNMIYKQLEYLAGAKSAGLVLGARIPIALTSRADGPMNRVSSAALSVLAAQELINSK